MKTFFAAMNEQVVSSRGYGAKIVSTPMGPFSWNDVLQVWVNNNNGMQMNNIAFQDMYAFVDYGSIGGGGEDIIVIPDPNPTLNPASWGGFNSTGTNGGIPDGTTNVSYASASGATGITGAANVVFTGINQPISVTMYLSNVTGNTGFIRYALNGSGTFAGYTTAISVTNGTSMKVAIQSLVASNIGTGTLTIYNASSGMTLAGITYIFTGI
jgi:hypothetical protein